MFSKYVTAGLVGSAMLASAAFAQSDTATSAKTAAPAAPIAASDSSFTGNWRASKVVGLSVYNASNESLGSINDLLTDQQGNIKAVIVGVGGFLGVGEHLVAVPFDKIKFVNEPVASATTASNAATGSGSSSSSSSSATTTTTTTPGMTTGAAPAAATSKSNPWYPDHGVLDATKDQLKAMPEFKYST